MAAAVPLHAESLAIAIRPHSGIEPKRVIHLNVQRNGGELWRVEAAGERPVVVDVPEGLYVVSLLPSESLWAAPATVYVQRGGTTSTVIDVHRAVTVRGRFRLSHGVTRPKEAAARFALTPNEEAALNASSECAVREEAWECRVPAGVSALSLKPAGFIGTHWWNLDLQADHDFGTLPLKEGASFIGRVVVPKDRRKMLREVVVRLEPKSIARSTEAEAASRAQVVALTARATSAGFFHFDGIAPGEYLATASLPGLTGRSRSIQIIPNVEAELREPLVLEPPHRVDIVVTPPQGPDDRPWTIVVSRETNVKDTFEIERQMRLPLGGGTTVADLPAGTYRLAIRDSEYNRFATRAFSVPDDDSVIAVTVDTVKARGKVMMGKRPLRATMWFGGEHGATSVSATSDSDGRFEVTLPAALGTTISEVDVAADHPPIKTTVRAVRVAESEGGERTLTIDVPRTALLGEVVAEDGSAVSRGLVTITLATGARIEVLVREDGSFAVYGLEPGPAFVAAVAEGKRQSDSLRVVIDSEVEQLDPIRLVVRESRVFKGRLVSSGGPVPGAAVFVFPADSRGFGAPRIGTAADGLFEQRLPPGTTAADVFVAAPGFAYAVTRQPVGRDLVDIPVTQTGGEIELAIERSAEDVAADRWPVVTHGGASRGLWLFFKFFGSLRPASAGWWTLRMANIEPGDYTFCAGSRCTSITLPPYGRVDARLPLDR